MNTFLSRRSFLRSAGGGAALAALGGFAPSGSAESPLAGPNASAIKSKPDVIVHRGGYPGWPWVARAGNRLVCVFRDDGIHGFSPTGRVLWTASEDEGKTWSPARVVADQEGVDDRNAAVAPMADGSLMVCYNTYTKDGVSRSMVTVSKDGGATWSAPTMIADVDARTRSAPLVLSSGDLLIPIYKAPGSGSIAARSADGGRSWQLADVPDVPGFVGDEWTVLEGEKGRLVGVIRNNGAPDGFFWKTESRDGGRTWRRPVRTNVQSARYPSPAHLDLHGKTPVLTYADRRMVSVSMVTTRDADFIRWDLETRLPCYRYRADGGAIADASYPVSVAVGPRRRLIVDYEIRPEGKWIAGYFVDLPAGWR
jgi:photosystem II stability/assembly factor-like uncharacterized protein